MQIPFGKYEGIEIRDIKERDPRYLCWCLDNCTNMTAAVRCEIMRALGLLADGTLAKTIDGELIGRWFVEMVREFQREGDEAMRVVERGYHLLKHLAHNAYRE